MAVDPRMEGGNFEAERTETILILQRRGQENGQTAATGLENLVLGERNKERESVRSHPVLWLGKHFLSTN